MGQFDKIEDTNKAERTEIENEVIKPEELFVGVQSTEELQAKETAKAENKLADQARIDELKNELIGKNESKEEFPEGHIMNSNMLDKIAQLEAISHDTFEIVQDRYEKYIKDEQEGRHQGYSVTSTQEKLKKLVEEGDDLKDVLYESDVIYGEGGWNRYKVDEETGMVKLDSGKSATNTTGSKQYFEALRSKARELGMDI